MFPSPWQGRFLHMAQTIYLCLRKVPSERVRLPWLASVSTTPRHRSSVVPFTNERDIRYWDWTLDWEDVVNSPIFSTTSGFGGNGDPKAPGSVGDGHCVTEGPFAHLKPLFYGPYDQPHCLSRGFTDFSGQSISPAAVEEIMASENYKNFFLSTENGPHNAIPNGVKGDFYSFTAPYGKKHAES